jgi:hypothetical protein
MLKNAADRLNDICNKQIISVMIKKKLNDLKPFNRKMAGGLK